MANPGEPKVYGNPNTVLDADLLFEMQNSFNRTVAGKIDLGSFLKALCQKLDADMGITDTDYELLFCGTDNAP